MKRAPTRLGGQAVIEGVMVRAGDQWAVAAGRPDGEIQVHRDTVPSWTSAGRRLPVLRGTVALASTVGLGMKTRRLTTRPPSDDQIEVAITAVDAALVRS